MLTTAEARALITTSLSDSDLAAVIARQEAWLARRVGPLDGTRTETFVTPHGDEVLRLARPAAAGSLVVVDEAGAVTDYELRGWSDIVRTAGSWTATAEVSYTADDEAEVKDSIITLVRLAVTESGYQAEAMQGYSATTDHDMRRRMRYEAWRGLLRRGLPQSVRLVSAIPPGGNTIGSVQVTAVAS